MIVNDKHAKTRNISEKTMMLKEEREQYILATLKKEGKVVATDLSRLLDVSEDTIRRDLRRMAGAGLLQRVHGGALPASPAVAAFTVRQQQSLPAKSAIAAAAVGLIQQGQVIIMDGGTTMVQAAHRLPVDLQATIITNSPAVAVALADYAHIEVVLIGGCLLKESLVTVGAATVEALSQIRADLCLLGVCSLHPDVGLSVPHLEEGHVKRAMIASAAEVAALATADKLGTATTYTVGPLSELTHLVTEAEISADTLAPYRKMGLSIVQP